MKKIKLTTKQLIRLGIGCLLLFVAAIQLSFYFSVGNGRVYTNVTYTNATLNTIDQLKPIDPVVPGSLPHDQYVKLRDSINEARKIKNGNAMNTSSFLFASVIGTTGSYLLCDTCTSLYWGTSKQLREAKIQYYIKLPAWKLKDATGNFFLDDSVKFYREHNQSYLRKRITTRTVSEGIYTDHRHEVDIPVKYSYETAGQCILIPVNKATRTVVNVIVSVLSLTLVLYSGYLLSCFLAFIVDLSRGKAFTTSNINTLRLIAVSLLIFPILIISLIFSMKLIFYQYFTPDVILNKGAWIDLWKPFATGIIFLLLFGAFKQGKALKDEQDLTV